MKISFLRWFILFFFLPATISMAAETIDLSGKWDFQIGSTQTVAALQPIPGSFSDTIHLPGTMSEAGKGEPCTVPSILPKLPPENFNPSKGIMYGRNTNYAVEDLPLMYLQQRVSCIGPAWYRRTVEIPKNWANKDVQLSLERVIWKSQVWVNGQYIGERNSLTTPHRYEIGPALKPGRNEIILCVDNRRQLAIGDPHAYTQHTQTIWNGVIGKLSLVARDKIHIDGLALRPDLARNGVEVTMQTHNDSGRETASHLAFRVAPKNFHGKEIAPMTVQISVPPGDSEQKFFYLMGTNFELWSEFNPKLYQMEATLDGENFHSKTTDTFGMREFKTSGDHFTINGQPTFLRGTVNCCEFPRTGYPDMTGKQWQKIFFTVKAYGLNHVRFHTWCPPEVAFETADRMGIYLEVELPNWCIRVGKDEIGRNKDVTQFFQDEGDRMIREYGNHPSWVMLTMGNELKGNYTILDLLVIHFKEIDPQLLYDSTTYPSSKARPFEPEPTDDYYVSQKTKDGRARGQDIFEDTVPNTETNYADAISCIPVPFISHEVGQYCVFPNLAELPKYDGILRSTAMEAIQADLKAKGRLAEAPVYVRDSGKLAALLYKEEIERALRTTNQAGFQLLQLNDFPGQGTSTVGLLDAFWDSKDLITPEEFREFCSPVVPLLLMPKRVYQNNELFDAGIEIANFGNTSMTNATVVWTISDGKKQIGEGSFQTPLIPQSRNEEIGRIHQSLSMITGAAKIKVTVEIVGTSIANDWDVWVYPEYEMLKNTDDIEIYQMTSDEFFKALNDGKRVLLLPTSRDVKFPLAAQFTPTFWNPVMFPNQPGSMGAMIDASHPIFTDFPTDDWTDWQWWELFHDSFSVNLDTINAKVKMPLRFIDKFNRNALTAAIFEARVGNGKLLVCTLDVSNDLESRIAARQLRRSILNYMASDKFKPGDELSPADLKELFE